MIGQGGWNGPELQVGQVWDLGDQQIVITGLKGEMTEYHACSGSKAMRTGRGHLATAAEIRKRLAAANATLVGAPSPPM
jgi:hypothetical protein